MLSPHGAIAQWDKKGSEKSFLFLSNPLKNQSLAFLDNNFSIIFVKKDVIPNICIKHICNVLDEPYASPSCDFTTSKELHNPHQIHEIIENIKYFVDYLDYVHDIHYIMNINSGCKERDVYEREQNN